LDITIVGEGMGGIKKVLLEAGNCNTAPPQAEAISPSGSTLVCRRFNLGPLLLPLPPPGAGEEEAESGNGNIKTSFVADGGDDTSGNSWSGASALPPAIARGHPRGAGQGSKAAVTNCCATHNERT
jgi:hypothetical protein